MVRPSRYGYAIAAALVLLVAAHVYAFESTVAELRVAGPSLRASVELRDAFPEKFREVLGSNGSLYVRIQTELWEDRPLWDRLVRPALVSVFRIARNPATKEIAVADEAGPLVSFAQLPDVFSLRVEVAPADSLDADSSYYVRLVTTIGTIAEREIEESGAAVFGRDDRSVGLGRVGRFIFRAVLQATDYLQSVSAESRSGKFRRSDVTR